MNQKVTLSELKEVVKGLIKEEISSKTPINKFVYFSYNYPQDFIKRIWGEDRIAQHLTEKFSSLYSKHGARGVMAAFYVELDMENQKMLEEYIINNYVG